MATGHFLESRAAGLQQLLELTLQGFPLQPLSSHESWAGVVLGLVGGEGGICEVAGEEELVGGMGHIRCSLSPSWISI